MSNYGNTNRTARDDGVEDCGTMNAIPAAFSDLQSALSLLESNAERLRDRLYPVLSSEQKNDGDGKCADLNSVPLAAQLETIIDRIKGLNYQTLDVLGRLHV